jgi:hypothetical protein
MLAVEEAKNANKRIPMNLRWLVFLFWPIAMPIVYIWCYKLKGVFYIILYSILFLVAFVLPHLLFAQ